MIVASGPEQLTGCDVAFVAADQAVAAQDAGVDEVLACSLTPFATRLAQLPAMVLDVAVELPGYGDHFSGRPRGFDVRVEDERVLPSALDLVRGDRVLTALSPAEGLGQLLGVLQAGAALILLAGGDQERALTQESATAWIDGSGLHRVG